MEQLLALAEELGLTIIERRGKHLGGFRPHENVIRLTPGMRHRTARSVLAHEIGHCVLGHEPTLFGPLRARQERAADEWAALHLIDKDAYIEVERLRDGHIASMAHDLDVAPELVTAFQRMLTRFGDAVYIDARMGTGQFTQRLEAG